ncbi:MAG: AbrB/MazE/SpoVT family DNA-binding domain-containing protein [Gammaproteobacteria bacterium]|nr:AbrB/MazE/SpoVT family DNA-binding domain-containing protein [Gammaproteobacteria bacterium]
MSRIATTKMSSKGQVVIPEGVRQELGLESGSQFMIMAEKDVIILKIITRPSMDDFSGLIAKTRKAVKQAGITKEDLKDAIKESRKKK